MSRTKIIPAAQGAHDYPLLIKSLLLSGVRYQPDQEIVYSDKFRYNYRDLLERVNRLANMLSAAGVKAGDIVAILDWDTPRYLECFFAVPMLGAVLHTVNVRLSPEQIAYTMNHAEDSVVLVNDDFVPLLSDIGYKLKTVSCYIQLSDGESVQSELPTLGEYEQLLAQASNHYVFPDFDERSVATLFYTTGTTGLPKGVYFSHRQLVLHTLNTLGAFGAYQGLPLLRSDDVYMPITPMFHVHGWGIPYVATMLGIKQVYPGRYEPDDLVRLHQKERVTFSHCVPTVLQMIINSDASKKADFSGWKVLLGGSALTLGLARQAAGRGIQVHVAFGMSETCPVICAIHLTAEELALPMEAQLPQRIKAGIPVAMVDLKILDATGQWAPHDGKSIGEVVVRAPWLTQGYLHDPQKGSELWEGGWLHTGDIASIDPNGVVEIKDRIKDVIKTGGEWICSLSLESLISEHPAVASVAVVAIPDQQWGERPMALIVCKSEQRLSRKQLVDYLEQYVHQGIITKWAVPREIFFVTEIPKTSVGKINKKQIRAEAEAIRKQHG
ncbi:fatty acid--CoA ligase [Pseudomonas hefeiensis]|uniref:Fatty acid--CoA ligase n=1 Tax=Pseudomonas hefeiensis TaxID=2738125 RepID=A0ABY9GI11_9PSED|nr:MULTISPECIES: fatty acid--CoA ligase [unclassified Pseudomonas]WLH14818.1 fatty acid--CoA ligase [Pseudomonas sp. FP205]WLH97871.1 fatty acid--CoA ligase [Pseudomonas sp. FP53]WLI42144.1 fatty acid--CoA ligase [Pseudomonas sp. FP821]